MFGSLDGVIDDVKKVTQNLQVLTALVYMIYNIESLYLKLKTMVLKAKAQMSYSSGYAASGAQARTFFTTPFPVVEILEKNPDPAMLEFSSPAIQGVPEFQKSPDPGTLLTTIHTTQN